MREAPAFFWSLWSWRLFDKGDAFLEGCADTVTEDDTFAPTSVCPE